MGWCILNTASYRSCSSRNRQRFLLKNELFDKMGITDYNWLTDEINGLPASGWRSSITSRDIIKLGSMAINKG